MPKKNRIGYPKVNRTRKTDFGGYSTVIPEYRVFGPGRLPYMELRPGQVPAGTIGGEESAENIGTYIEGLPRGIGPLGVPGRPSSRYGDGILNLLGQSRSVLPLSTITPGGQFTISDLVSGGSHPSQDPMARRDINIRRLRGMVPKDLPPAPMQLKNFIDGPGKAEPAKVWAAPSGPSVPRSARAVTGAYDPRLEGPSPSPTTIPISLLPGRSMNRSGAIDFLRGAGASSMEAYRNAIEPFGAPKPTTSFPAKSSGAPDYTLGDIVPGYVGPSAGTWDDPVAGNPNVNPLARNTAAAPPGQSVARTKNYFKLIEDGYSPKQAIAIMSGAPLKPGLGLPPLGPRPKPPLPPAFYGNPMLNPRLAPIVQGPARVPLRSIYQGRPAYDQFVQDYRPLGSGGGTSMRAQAAAFRAGLGPRPTPSYGPSISYGPSSWSPWGSNSYGSSSSSGKGSPTGGSYHSGSGKVTGKKGKGKVSFKQ